MMLAHPCRSQGSVPCEPSSTPPQAAAAGRPRHQHGGHGLPARRSRPPALRQGGGLQAHRRTRPGPSSHHRSVGRAQQTSVAADGSDSGPEAPSSPGHPAKPLTSARPDRSGDGWWGKRRTLRWEEDVLAAAQTPSVFIDGIANDRHPAGHVRWTPEDITPGPGPGLPVPTASAARVNSAASVFGLPVSWARVYQRAEKLREEGTASGGGVVNVLCPEDFSPGVGVVGLLPVADSESLERCLAASLLDLPVALRASLPTGSHESRWAEANGLKGEMSIDEGWELCSRGPSQLQLLMSPEVLVCSRDTELCCWPKVWEFAKILTRGGEAAEALGAVPAAWCPARSRWVVSNRHRAVAALLLGVPLLCVVSLPQRTSGGGQWRGPASKTRLKRAQRASALLRALDDPPGQGDARQLERAIKACEQALHKAPLECDSLGVTREALDGLRAALKASSATHGS